MADSSVITNTRLEQFGNEFKSSLSNVAVSGDFSDLKNVPDLGGDVFTGATSSKEGKKGLVPAPAIITSGDKFLCHDGTWKEIDTGLVKSFSQATDSEITVMLGLHRAGIIDLTTVWAVGEEHKVHLNAIPKTITSTDLMNKISENNVLYDEVNGMNVDETIYTVGEEHVEQDITLTILNGPNMYDLVDGGKNNFVIGCKNTLANNSSREGGYINSTNTNVGGWKNSARRPWCDYGFLLALPEEVQKWFKKFKYKVSAGNKSTTIETLENYFTFASEIEIFGSTTYSAAGEGTQFDYYKTAANRKKYPGDSSTSADSWWERSPRASNTGAFCNVSAGGGADAGNASGTRGLAPFGVI